jgi:hypothetical protein
MTEDLPGDDIPLCHSRESRNPEENGSPIRSGMTKKGMGMAEKAQI